jgi:DNA polymerase-3 subunit alpha
MEELVNERESNGPFNDVFDVMRRASTKAINKRQLENMVRAGVFDSLHDNRRQLHENVELLTRYASVAIAERNSLQGSLFGDDAGLEAATLPKMQDVKDWSGQERLMHEFEAIGLYLGEHPISQYESMMMPLKVLFYGQMSERLVDGNSSTNIVGVLTSKRMRSSQRGRYATIMLSDPTAMFEVSVFDENLLSSARELLEVGNIVLIRADTRKDEGGVRLTAQSIELMEDVIGKRSRVIDITLSHTGNIVALTSYITANERGKARVYLTVTVENKLIKLSLPGLFDVQSHAIEAMRSVDGVMEVNEALA